MTSATGKLTKTILFICFVSFLLCPSIISYLGNAVKKLGLYTEIKIKNLHHQKREDVIE
ncbi:hypothetical protein CUZ95_1261 [Enterococcus lactis]|nr:hypothetical protein [Enterococcus lactis]